MAKKWIVANLKLYKGKKETLNWLKELLKIVDQNKNNIVVCPSALFIDEAYKLTKNTNVKVGGQDCSTYVDGAFTGEISASALSEEGASVVIIGHSERRRLFFENNSIVLKKLEIALNLGLTAIVCLSGESKDDYVNEIDAEVRELTKGIDPSFAKKIIFAYEPVFAIGTGVSMEPKLVNSALAQIKTTTKDVFGKSTFAIYGGSVNLETASEFLKEKNIDGLLIGKASKDASVFAKICEL